MGRQCAACKRMDLYETGWRTPDELRAALEAAGDAGGVCPHDETQPMYTRGSKETGYKFLAAGRVCRACGARVEAVSS